VVAVKGFGNFQNDQSLSQEQIELITKWVNGDIRRGCSTPLRLPAGTVIRGVPPNAVLVLVS
jgi:hypothetical protein